MRFISVEGGTSVKRLDQIPDKVFLLNLYLTQALALIIAIVMLFLQDRRLFDLFTVGSWGTAVAWGVLFASAVILLDLGVSYLVPDIMMDDGGTNEKLFKNRNVVHIVFIAAVVAVVEELLFRGAIQPMIGPYWTSIVFTLIHIRYLQHWLLTGTVFVVSYGLGWLVIQTDMLMTAIIAHFLIDLIMGLMIRMGWSEKKEV